MANVALGIIGHRYLIELDKILVGVETALKRIRRDFPDAKFQVLSSLAEGADRVVSERVLAIHGSSLWVPLPFPAEEYLKDFVTTESKEEFIRLLEKAERVIDLPVHGDREDAYLAAGKYVIRHSDILIAIWDGNSAQGVPGSAEMVNLARERSLPLAWIHAGNRIPGTEFPTSLGSMQGKVTFENFPSPKRKI